MNRSNRFNKYRNLRPSDNFQVIAGITHFYETDSSNEKAFIVIISPPKSRYSSKVISGRLVDKYPFSLDDKVKEARKKLARMSKAQKWKLIEESFGMWKDYPEDWLERIREGKWIYNHARDTNESNYFVCS